MRSYNPIIVALDYDNLNDARKLVSDIRPYVGMLKIGLQLFTAAGKEAFDLSREFNIPLFVDLKLHDIPKTVGKTMGVLCSQLVSCPGPHFVSVHTLGSKAMLAEAYTTAKHSNVVPAGVTILTSHTDHDLRDLSLKPCRAGNNVVNLIDLSIQCVDNTLPYEGLDTFVCPAPQLDVARKHFNDVKLIVPGIRDDHQDKHDHKRTKSVSWALSHGADWLVIGRPITLAGDPVEAARSFKEICDRY